MSIRSTLDTSAQRFLSVCLQAALRDGWLTPEALVNEFPPEEMMEALEGAPDLRAHLLVDGLGVHERIAPKKSTSAAAEDLRIALDEGVLTPDALLVLFDIHDQVRHLGSNKLWALLIRDEFFLEGSAKARARMCLTVQTAIEQELIDLTRLVRSVSTERIAQELPKELLERALVSALESGISGAAMSPDLFLQTISLEEIVEHVPLTHLWEQLVLNEIVPSAGLASSSMAPAEPKKVKAPKAQRSRTVPGSAPAPAEESASAVVNSAEEAARTRALANLAQLDRTPQGSDGLATPVLLAIDAMYAELNTLTDDDARADCIRESFPNPAMLEEALLSLAGSLDPRLDVQALKEKGASADSLIQLVLFEERRRVNRTAARNSSPPPSVREGSVPPPPASVVAPRVSVSSPPPLPGAARASAPPPPLPPQARKA